MSEEVKEYRVPEGIPCYNWGWQKVMAGVVITISLILFLLLGFIIFAALHVFC